ALCQTRTASSASIRLTNPTSVLQSHSKNRCSSCVSTAYTATCCTALQVTAANPVYWMSCWNLRHLDVWRKSGFRSTILQRQKNSCDKTHPLTWCSSPTASSTGALSSCCPSSGAGASKHISARYTCKDCT